jgi:hypothetical protein
MAQSSNRILWPTHKAKAAARKAKKAANLPTGPIVRGGF